MPTTLTSGTGVGDGSSHEVVVHEHVVLPVDGTVVEGDGVVDQAAITGETLPVSVGVGMVLPAGSVLLRGRIVVRACAVGCDTAIGRAGLDAPATEGIEDPAAETYD